MIRIIIKRSSKFNVVGDSVIVAVAIKQLRANNGIATGAPAHRGIKQTPPFGGKTGPNPIGEGNPPGWGIHPHHRGAGLIGKDDGGVTLIRQRRNANGTRRRCAPKEGCA